MKIRKSHWIQVHVYAGLFCAFYLLAFAISSLLMNHNVSWENTKISKSWHTDLNLDTSLSMDETCIQVRDRLGIMGWIPYWETKSEGGKLHFKVTQLGRESHILVETETGRIWVKEVGKGFWATFQGLHFFNGGIPNGSLFLRSWAVYQWMTMILMVVSLLVGLWLWIKYTRKKRLLWLFISLWIFSLLLIWKL